MRETRGDKILNVFNYVLLALAGLVCILPVVNVFATAFSDSVAVESGQVGLWPVNPTLDSFKLLIKGTMAFKAFGNSVVITLVGTTFSMLMTIAAAYPLSKSYFVLNGFFTKAIVFTMLFSGGMIPSYIVIQKFGLIDNYAALWLPAAISTYNMLIMRTFFHNIPAEIEEAAIIDGCGELRLMWGIYLPLSVPVIATLTLFYGVAHWNAFMSVLLYINDPAKQNLSVLVQQMIKSMNVLNNEIINANPEDLKAVTTAGIRASGVVVMVLPMLAVYPVLQKYYVKGIMLGSVKG